jgi:hypothetical protein
MEIVAERASAPADDRNGSVKSGETQRRNRMTVLTTPKSRFISILSMTTMMVALYSIVGTISTLSMQNSQEFQLVRQFMPAAVVSPAMLYAEMFLNAAAIVAAVGLFLRRNWGRILFLVVLFLYIGWEIYSSISSYLSVNALLAGYGIGGSLSLIVSWSLLGLGLNVFLIWKLYSSSIRSEFQ